MNAAPPPLPTCSACQSALDPNGSCPRCRAPEDWADQIEAIDFVVRRLRDWQQNGELSDRQLQSLTEHYDKRRQEMQTASAARECFRPEPTFAARDHCWSCDTYLYTNSSHCSECGAPILHPGVKSLRYWHFLQRELEKLEESGWLNLRQAHEMVADTQERIDALQRKLERERALPVVPVGEEPPPSSRTRLESERPARPEAASRNFLEVLLDPQTIQWLLAAGGALLVLGIIIFLATLDLFKNAGFVALALGLGNASLLGGGWALILKTRYHNAGRALTLLACLVMPLNLWFYHTNQLITIDNHLWIAALVCCIIYTASALVLKDSLFVYVLVGGVTLTGLLILAQMSRFGEVLAPTLLLITLGLIALHAERAFPPEPGSFSRERFGLAFYWSSQGLFAVGLLLLLGAQLVGWLHQPLFRHLGMREMPDVAKREFLPWTLLIVLAGTYAYVYSDLVVRRIGVYLYLAAITLLWAEIHVLVLSGVEDTGMIVIVTLALTGLAINVVTTLLESQQPFLRRAFPLGAVLSVIPVVLGVLMHFRAVNFVLQREWPFEISWSHVGAMAVTAVCCRAGAFLYRNTLRDVAVTYYFLTSAATLVFAASLAWMIGLKPWETEAPFLMVIPILYLVASHFYRGQAAEGPMLWCGHASTAVMIVCSLWAAVMPQVVEQIEGPAYHLLLAAFCLEATLFYALAGILNRSQVSLYLAAVMFCGAVWQLLITFDLPSEFYVLAFAITGFVLVVMYRFGVFEKLEMPILDRAIFQSANALTTLGFVSGALLSLSRALMSEHALAQLDKPGGPGGDWHNPIRFMLYLLIFLSVLGLASAALVNHPAWRRVHLVLSIVNGVLIAVMIHKLSTLSPWQKIEIFTVVVGLALLGAAYFGWYRETERSSDVVSIAFLFGSACLVLPLLLATGIHRFHLHDHEPSWDDLGLILACIALFASGVVCRIKASTLIGVAAFVVYMLIILIDLHRHLKQQWIIGIYLTLGGAVLFGAGLVLSVYRDRLLTLPARIRRREGIFRIFDWR